MPEIRPRRELARQYQLFNEQFWPRLLLTYSSYLLAIAFVPLPMLAAVFICDATLNLTQYRLLNGLDPQLHLRRYQWFLACTFGMSFCYAGCAVLIGLSGAPYSEPLAVALLLLTLMQLSTARALHLPAALCGLAGVGLCVLIGLNTFWAAKVGTTQIVLANIATLLALGYALLSILTTHKLHRDNLTANVAAEEASAVKARFLAQMGHELRTPLNAILGMGHAELRRSHDHIARQRLSVLVSAAEGLATILDDILDLSGIENGRMPIRPEVVRLSSTFENLLSLYRPGIEAHGLQLVEHIDPKVSQPLRLDEQRLRQCLANLLSNAIKHTLKGEIRFCVRLIEPSDVGQPLQLEVIVADTGPGIPPHLREQVFLPFTKSPDLPTAQRTLANPLRGGPARPESNGLGLSISRALARQMGGDLIVMPDPPADQRPPQMISGSRFRLTITVETVAEADIPEVLRIDPKAAGRSASEPPSANRFSLNGLRVLLVDDTPTNRLVASTYLRMLGAKISEAASGAEALKTLSHTPHDLVLLDMNMPEMSGAETLMHLRAQPGALGVMPVIAMTANSANEHANQDKDRLSDGYLPKPLHPERMAEEIARVLARHRALYPPSERG